MATCKNHLNKAVLTSTNYLCFGQKHETYQNFYLKTLRFWRWIFQYIWIGVLSEWITLIRWPPNVPVFKILVYKLMLIFLLRLFWTWTSELQNSKSKPLFKTNGTDKRGTLKIRTGRFYPISPLDSLMVWCQALIWSQIIFIMIVSNKRWMQYNLFF